MEENIKTYITKVSSFPVDGQVYLGIEVPEGFIIDMNLIEGEHLQWDINTDEHTATLTKTKFVDNN